MNDLYVRAILCLKNGLQLVVRQFVFLINLEFTQKGIFVQRNVTQGTKNRKKISLRKEKNYIWLSVAVACLLGTYWQVITRLYSFSKRIHHKILKRNALKLFALSFSFSTSLFCVCLAYAGQREISPAATGVALAKDSITPLTIGDNIPETLWHLPLQMVKAGQEGSTTVKLSDYKNKLIILDFWATWCGGCINEMPKVARLKAAYKKEVMILSATQQDTSVVLPFFQRNKLLQNVRLHIISHASDLAAYFPHRSLPHVIWIGKDGKYKGATSSIELNAAQIENLLKTGTPAFTTWKRDVLAINYKEPILIGKQAEQLPYLCSSNLTPYLDGYPSRLGQRKDSTCFRVYATNIPLLTLFKWGLNLPLSWPQSRVQIVTPGVDKEVFQGGQSEQQLRAHSYCYELLVPLHAQKHAKQLLLQDLNRYFGYEATVRKQPTKCWVLTCTDKKPVLSAETNGFNNLGDATADQKIIQGQPVEMLIGYLNNLPNFKPVIDETGITYPVDLKLDNKLLNEKHANEVLAAYHLQLIKASRNLEMLVIHKNQ